MSKRRYDLRSRKNSKQPKPNDTEPNEIAVLNQETSPAIFKLNAICCDDLFEWLSFMDLHSLGQTCKRMHRLTGLYFQENYKEKSLYCRNENIYSYLNFKETEFTEFAEFVQFIQLGSYTGVKGFEYIGKKCPSLRQIVIDFCNVYLDKKIMINSIKGTLGKIELMHIRNLSPTKEINLHADILRFCPNLKTLELTDYDYRVKMHWLEHTYPKLEHLSLYSYKTEYFDCNLRNFFNNNAQLQSFLTNDRTFVSNSNTFINLQIKLDVLHIRYSGVIPSNFDKTCTLLNQLYDNGFYKRLAFTATHFMIIKQDQINKIGALGGLEKLFGWFEGGIVFPTIVNLKELSYRYQLKNIDLEPLAIAFPKLQKLYLLPESEQQLYPLLRRSSNLKEIHVLNEHQFNLSKLNAERKKLPRAGKVIFYLKEHVYLKTKMDTKNLYANHDLIEIKRSTSVSKIFG